MTKDPVFDAMRIACYPTIRQKELLEEVARESAAPFTELVREAIHYLLKKEGKDDGIICDRQEMYEGYLRGIKEMAVKAVLRRKEKEQEKAKRERNAESPS